MSNKYLIALAGQPNAGKSTIFNMLTGARQHVANYPGVTVEKKVGSYSINSSSVELVDLPGTYSLTSYSLEERVARDFILQDCPTTVVNVADASNLKRHLYLTFQLLEMEAPVVVALNMMDVAESRNQCVDAGKLAERLGCPVIPCVGRKGTGKQPLKDELFKTSKSADSSSFIVDYADLEPFIVTLEKRLGKSLDQTAPARWVAVKLLEGDSGVRTLLEEVHEDADFILSEAKKLRQEFEKKHKSKPEPYIELRRYELATSITDACVVAPEEGKPSISDKVDRIICHRFLGYPILFAVMYLMYYLSIEWGYEITNYTWPWLAGMRSFVAGLLPAEGFVTDPMFRALILWVMDSCNALLNYVPIFLILFAYIAFLEDLGYMPRMAFLLDAFFRRYGLHGQSTLPLVLGGVYVGGCAVPGVMACRAVPDERARLATILVVPMMNCLAKVPLYVLLIGIYFAAYKGQAMFFIATITVLMALTTSKLLNLTVLKNKESAPFIMEMPPYHTPTVGNIMRRAIERTLIYIQKIATVVIAVTIILFVLMQFPGVPDEKLAALNAQADKAQAVFIKAAKKADVGPELDSPEEIDALFSFAQRYKDSRFGVTDRDKAKAIDKDYKEENSIFFAVLKSKDKKMKALGRAYKKLRRVRLKVRKEVKDITINTSFLGTLGHMLEPITKYAGFTWKVNVSLLAALAAKENTVATLGALYQPEEDAAEVNVGVDGNGKAQAQGAAQTLETRMAEQESGFTSLHALALMLFMALYPPCMATTMVVKVQSGSWKWMAFSLVYMMCLGAVVSVLVFTGGSALGLSGVEAMAWFYGLALAATVITGLINPQPTDT